MTEIEKVKGEIKVLQAKLELLKEMENFKTPAEEAFKRVYCRYPDKLDSAWDPFEKGYARAQKDYKVGEYQPTPQTPEETAEGLRNAMIQAKKDGVFDEPEYYDEIEWDIKEGTAPPEPTPTVFRQKLFDGIKSVFYDPDYERTHWKHKVNMAVDEVLMHFYEVIPNKKEIVSDFEKGWNCCLVNIEMCMEHTDD
jgi:hypothetical protein